jgi:hypothetical protein
LQKAGSFGSGFLFVSRENHCFSHVQLGVTLVVGEREISSHHPDEPIIKRQHGTSHHVLVHPGWLIIFLHSMIVKK